jgi:predicted DNA-binding protein (MmcQ/YjbR family)
MAMAMAEPHPYVTALYEHCAKKPDAVEDHPWGETVFKVKGRVFAFLGRGERAGVTVKVPPEELELLLSNPSVSRARYVGRYGWVSVRIEDDETLELALGLIDDSYELISAPRPRKR